MIKEVFGKKENNSVGRRKGRRTVGQSKKNNEVEAPVLFWEL